MSKQTNLLLGSKTTPLYPIELSGTEEIHQFVPHLPVYKVSDGRVTIAVGDHETPHIRLGLLISRAEIRPSMFELKIVDGEQGQQLLPNSIGLRKRLSGDIATFIVDVNKRNRMKAVKAFDDRLSPIEISWMESANLLPFMVTAVRRAFDKNRLYPRSK